MKVRKLPTFKQSKGREGQLPGLSLTGGEGNKEDFYFKKVLWE